MRKIKNKKSRLKWIIIFLGVLFILGNLAEGKKNNQADQIISTESPKTTEKQVAKKTSPYSMDKKISREEKALFITAAQKKLSEKLKLKNIEIDYNSIQIKEIPSDELENGVKLNNLYGGYGDFYFQDKGYSFDLIINYEGENYRTIYLTSDYSGDLINLPLKSE